MAEKKQVRRSEPLRVSLARLLVPQGWHVARNPARHSVFAPEPEQPPVCSRCGFAYFGEHTCEPSAPILRAE